MAGQDHRPTVLLAEDNVLIGLDLRDALEDAGYRVAGPFRKAADAAFWLRQDPPDLAVLDVTLLDGSCEALAQDLRRQAVPFLVYSGRRCDEVTSRAFDGCPWFDKPAALSDLIARLTALAPAPTGLVSAGT